MNKKQIILIHSNGLEINGFDENFNEKEEFQFLMIGKF